MYSDCMRGSREQRELQICWDENEEWQCEVPFHRVINTISTRFSGKERHPQPKGDIIFQFVNSTRKSEITYKLLHTDKNPYVKSILHIDITYKF